MSLRLRTSAEIPGGHGWLGTTCETGRVTLCQDRQPVNHCMTPAYSHDRSIGNVSIPVCRPHRQHVGQHHWQVTARNTFHHNTLTSISSSHSELLLSLYIQNQQHVLQSSCSFPVRLLLDHKQNRFTAIIQVNPCYSALQAKNWSIWWSKVWRPACPCWWQLVQWIMQCLLVQRWMYHRHCVLDN